MKAVMLLLHLKKADPIHKATIIPRGRALGMVMRLPERDQLSTREKHQRYVAMVEELLRNNFGHDKVTSGASSILTWSLKMAKNMGQNMG